MIIFLCNESVSYWQEESEFFLIFNDVKKKNDPIK